ncbi:type II toxin-antitoxin system RelE/ParE family toxin [Pelovirga terrestris]|uniref:Type II toxin-antitoxin system RelE/ParE family toxin n=1 Tax=Pelovirga terrestris TaxID=2771352 RepID=A0A8J6QRH8_9BACT|nr:type II toxin-antitoxin system RelE/ParE family toxin [Pelovirga terrestris]MBD1400285.1 type II toxin-antitoxin system RelE/ParE family toxin [Pelovirga terrestris]
MLEIKQTATYQRWQGKLKDRRAKALIAARVFRLANGLPGDVKSIGQGVRELRIHFGPGYRVYFYQRGNELILLLCGGDKGSQKKDIEVAIQLADQWRIQ